MKVTVKSIGCFAFLTGVSVGAVAMPAFSGEKHGRCSGANVCKGDATCEKQGYKEMWKEECVEIEGAKFDSSSHTGDKDKGGKHDHN